MVFAIEVQHDILAIDCDQPERAYLVRFFANELKRAGVFPVVVGSGRPSHLHLFARVSDRASLARFKAQASSLGLEVREGAKRIRPPLSPHRMGLPVSLVSPKSVEEALRALSAIGQRRPRQLSARMAALLRFGDRESRYKTRSEVVMALALGAANAGLSEGWLLKALLDPKNVGGEKVRELADSRNENAARRYVSGAYSKAATRVVRNPPLSGREDARRIIASIESDAGAALWRGRAGGTDFAVLTAHVAIARRSGKLVYGASVREVADLAGVCPRTVSNAQTRLRHKGWLRMLGRHERYVAALWKLCPVRTQMHIHPHTPREGRSDCARAFAARPADDVWRSAALGKRRMLLWQALDGQTTKDLSCRFGVGLRAIQKHLKMLNKHGLATRLKDGTWSRIDRDLEQVAETLGCAGEGLRQRERHCQEREYYRGVIARHRRQRRQAAMFLAGHPLCVKCLAEGRTEPATQVDHVVPLAQGGADTESNYQGLCDSHRSRKTTFETLHRGKESAA